MQESLSSKTNSPRILVTGSSSLVGCKLLSDLAAKKGQVLALYEKKKPKEATQVLPVYSNYLNINLLSSQLQSARAVIHLEWNYSDTGEDIASSNNMMIMKSLIDSAVNAGSKRMIFVSSIGASPNSSSKSLRLKYEAETMLLNSKIPEKIIFRIPTVFSEDGLGDCFNNDLLSLMKIPLIIPIKSPNRQLNPVHVDDVSQVILKLIDYPMIESSGILQAHPSHNISFINLIKYISIKKFGYNKTAFTGAVADKLFRKLLSKNLNFSEKIDEMCSGRFDSSIEINNPFESLLPKFYKSINTTFKEENYKAKVKMVKKEGQLII